MVSLSERPLGDQWALSKELLLEPRSDRLKVHYSALRSVHQSELCLEHHLVRLLEHWTDSPWVRSKAHQLDQHSVRTSALWLVNQLGCRLAACWANEFDRVPEEKE